MQEERRVPDILYSVIISVVLLLALLTHLPSLILIIRDFKRPNNVNLIYRNLFLVDTVLMLVYIPMDIIWTQTRQNQFLCQFKQANLFLVFFAGCNFLITLAVDRWGDTENCTFRDKKNNFLKGTLQSSSQWNTWPSSTENIWPSVLLQTGCSPSWWDYGKVGSTRWDQVSGSQIHRFVQIFKTWLF